MDELEEGKSNFKIYSTLFLEKYESLTLHDHQRDALTSTIKYFQNEKNDISLLVLPTGTGKTRIISFLPYVLNKNKVLIITPSAQITEQIEKEMSVFGETFYEKVGFEKEEIKKFIEKPLIVLESNDLKKMEKSNFIITNAHKFGNNSKGINYSISKTMLIY